MNKDTNLTLSKQSTNNELLSFSDNKEMFTFFKQLVISKNIGVNTAEEAVSIYLHSKELGLGFVSASNHMHIVNGKTSLDIHVIKALLLRAGTGIWWELIEDFVPLYKYIDSDKNYYVTGNLPKDSKIVYTKEQYTLAQSDGLLPLFHVKSNGVSVVVDRRTTYKFSREYKKLDGTIGIRISLGQFTLSKATDAQLGYNKQGNLDSNSPWYKYPYIMVNTRAFTYGARDIASDLLLGSYETSELMEINNRPYDISDEGKVVDIKHEEVAS